MDDAVREKEVGWWDFWNTTHRSSDSETYDPVSSELFARTSAVVNELLPDGQGRALEIACGTGIFSRLIRCSRYHGLDISPAAIELARERARLAGDTTRTYEAADIHEWPAPSQPYDLAVCVDAVAYFSDQKFALEKIAASLHSGGRLVLTTINPFVYNRIKRTTDRPLREGLVSHWLSKGELHALIAASGFTLERSWTMMPRGNRGILRLINSRRIDAVAGSGGREALKSWREKTGLGQYRIVVARKKS